MTSGISQEFIICTENCACHDGADYDQIECSCTWYCGYEKKDVPNWKQLNAEHKAMLERLQI